tara:strand:- start:222 stop:524 length:303 start_codon:yes stop_codon:yes gene_type:complete
MKKKKIKFLKNFLNSKIPGDKKFKMPKFSSAVSIEEFLYEVEKDPILKKKIRKLIDIALSSKAKTIEKIYLKLENILYFLIICKYYSSKIVLKKLKNFNR